MKIQILEGDYPRKRKDAGTVELTKRVVATLQELTPDDRHNFTNELRLNLLGRVVTTLDDRELTKLQGKVEYIDELERLLGEIAKQRA